MTGGTFKAANGYLYEQYDPATLKISGAKISVMAEDVNAA